MVGTCSSDAGRRPRSTGRRMLKKVYKLSDEQAPLPAYTFFNARLACFENLCRNIAGFMVD